MASRISFDRLPGGPHPRTPSVLPGPARPVFVDATGARRQRIRRAGVLAAVTSLSYLPMAAFGLLPGPATPMLPGPVSVGGAPSGGPTRPPAVALSPRPTDRRPAPRPTDTVDAPPAPAATRRPAGDARPAPRRVGPVGVDAPADDRPASPDPTTSPTPTPDDPTPPATPTPPAASEPGAILPPLPGPGPEIVG
ncbi:hypothetical protein AB0F68_24255 [Micromonospora sp. NPDC023966]|uniref:hypothetical protein n=1 Tax=Micromonospora sp. NPDC023966 TaxID=3154699 RepID=UPI0033FB6628